MFQNLLLLLKVLIILIALESCYGKNHYLKRILLSGVSDNTYSLGYFSSSPFNCIAKCAKNLKCHVLSFSTDRMCSLYSIKAYHQLVYSTGSYVYVKQTYLSEYLDGLTNYWIGSSDGFDIISDANLYGGVNVQSTTNKNGEANSAFLFDNGYYQVPQGVYFSGDFTVSAWVKLTRFGNNQRLIDFGISREDNIVITVSHNVQGSNYVKLLVSNGNNALEVKTANQIRIGIWEHVTVVLQGTISYIYLNGVLDFNGSNYSMPIPNNVQRSNNFIGRSNWLDYDPDVSASISNIKIFNKALNVSEIKFYMDKF